MPDLKAMDWGALVAADALTTRLIVKGATADTVAAQCPGGLIYLAVPYAREVITGGRWRFEKSVEVANYAAFAMHRLALRGCKAIAPVILWAEMAHAASALPAKDRIDPLDEDHWLSWVSPILQSSDLLVVAQIAGWERSPTVWREVIWAVEHGVPVHFMSEARK